MPLGAGLNNREWIPAQFVCIGPYTNMTPPGTMNYKTTYTGY